MPLLVNCSCGPASVLNLEATWNSHWSCVAELQLLCKENVALWKCTTEEHSMYLSPRRNGKVALPLPSFFFFFYRLVNSLANSFYQTPAVPHCS